MAVQFQTAPRNCSLNFRARAQGFKLIPVTEAS
jgi:hypothetical protein